MARKIDLEDRLVSSGVMSLSEKLTSTKAGAHLAGQLVRSGTAPALYGEAQGAESREDFIHKMKIALRELKETRVCLKLIAKIEWLNKRKRFVAKMKKRSQFSIQALKRRKETRMQSS